MKLKPVMVAGIINDIRRIFQVLTDQSRKVEHETCLTSTQLWVVKLLKETSPMKVSDLARCMYLHPATMVGLLDRLEAKGLINRTRSEKDRRVVHIDLTGQGHELKINSPEVVKTFFIDKLEKLTGQELNIIYDGFEQFVHLLGAENVRPEPIMLSDINAPKRRKKSIN